MTMLTSLGMKAQLGLQIRPTGVAARSVRQPRAFRPSRLAVASAESDAVAAVEEVAPAAPAPAAPQEERRERRTQPRRGGQRSTLGPERTMQIADIEIGKEYAATIVSVTDFGAFVNIGASNDGLVHISQLSTEFVRNVADVAAVGQELTVRVLSVDEEKGKFAATAIPAGQEPPKRRSFNDDNYEGDTSGPRGAPPRQARQQKQRRDSNRQPIPVSAGDTIKGKIASVAPFGVFIEVGNGHSGMLHSSQMKLPEGVQDHLGSMKEGDELEVRVMSVARDKIALTMKSEEEVKADKDARENGLSAAVVVPEGVSGMAYLFARAGITAEQFETTKEEPKKEAPKAEVKAEKAAPAPAAEEKAEEAPKVEAKKEAAPAAAAPAAAGTISAAVVKELREATGAGMMDCKKALAENGGDLEAAKEFLRKKGLASADKKSSRIAAEGAVWSYIHAGSRLGVLVEVNCETDFVARGEKFKELVNDMAMQIAACPDVLVVSPSDVPAEVLERERAIEMQKEDLLSKPEAIREKIVQGRVDKIANEKALLEQAFVKDTSKTVGEHIKEAIAAIGENIQVRRFTKFNLGEGIETVDKGDFAAEVEAQSQAMQAKAAEKKEEAPKEEEPKKEATPAVAVSAAVVKQLRQETGAGMMDCKKALAENGGDVDVAREYLRKKGLASADKKSSRVAAEGAVGAYIHAGSRLGVLVEVNCETDFVARGEVFKELVNDMAMQVAACPSVIVANASDVPAEVLEREKAIEMQKEDLLSKPEAMREKIAQGRVDKLAKEMALMEQAFIKDTSKTVAEHIKAQIATIGENIQIRRFERFVLGEGVEKKEVDFAAEVAAQTGGRA